MDITPDDLSQNADAESTLDEVRDAIDEVHRGSAMGSLVSAITETIQGINIMQTPGVVPYSRDLQGYAFFTRPTMNMSDTNLRLVRSLAKLLDNRENSLRRMIRACLDIDAVAGKYPSTLLDPYQAFIPILTNQLISISGFPDKEVTPYTSKPGYYQEVVSFVDSPSEHLGTFEVSANFRNIPGDPITEMLSCWLDYMSNVFQGIIIPKHKYLVRQQIDYQTRIYRLVMDPNKRYVQNIFAANAAFPLNAPVGARATIEEGGPQTQVNNQISVRFHCVGFISNDDILIDEFNAVVARANSSMKDGYRASDMQLLEEYDKFAFRARAYPRINPDTKLLEWWVDKELYARMFNYTSDSDDAASINIENVY